ncbi:aldo/keto reductase family oxidoreductase [Paractinoplanes lichenicola]|uniref:Aldo/keto reductase family oxidoreductase n=1 Tax=Paractinoplanes lichenicola TaxID=2802976 RepID=A0ABS1VIP0_9ACTN|nr:aldo/keto reductase family oxidoreductase [Actinoplanes lichenicola]MBL7253336.1 aldo/keto reductase family oxidoreductase [Actinoplanes lichenicola]
MSSSSLPGGLWTLGDLSVTRFGYGAMQLAGPGVMGPPADHDGALAVLREAVELGITHIDTAGVYGPHIVNRLIREALHPYPDTLHIVTKVGANRDAQGGWPPARKPDELRRQVHENLKELGVDVLDLVNLRLGNAQGVVPGSLAEAYETLVELQQQGLIRHLGVSNATAEQVAEAQSIAPIVCVQNMYNLAHRDDDKLIDTLAEQGIAYVPFIPLGGGFSPYQTSALAAVAARLGATPLSVALSWLLRRSPNMLLIPGTSSVAHLRENIAGAALELSTDDLADLNEIELTK